MLAFICIILWHYLDPNDHFEAIKGKIIVEILFIYSIGYGIHKLVECFFDKAFPVNADEIASPKSTIYGMSEKEIVSITRSLSRNQLLWMTEYNDADAYCLLTLDDKVFDLDRKKKDQWNIKTDVLTIKNEKKEECFILLFLSVSDSAEALLKKAEDKLSKTEIVKKYTINTSAGEVLVQTLKKIGKENQHLIIFIYKVQEHLYFDGNFWLSKDSNFNENEIIAAIFQKVQFFASKEELLTVAYRQ